MLGAAPSDANGSEVTLWIAVLTLEDAGTFVPQCSGLDQGPPSRYPIPRSVRMYRGRSGVGSIFFRRFAI